MSGRTLLKPAADDVEALTHPGKRASKCRRCGTRTYGVHNRRLTPFCALCSCDGHGVTVDLGWVQRGMKKAKS